MTGVQTCALPIYIKSVNLDNVPLKPLTGSDWIKPGRPATDEELEQMCVEMEAEEGEFTTKEMKELAKQWKKKKSL